MPTAMPQVKVKSPLSARRAAPPPAPLGKRYGPRPTFASHTELASPPPPPVLPILSAQYACVHSCAAPVTRPEPIVPQHPRVARAPFSLPRVARAPFSSLSLLFSPCHAVLLLLVLQVEHVVVDDLARGQRVGVAHQRALLTAEQHVGRDEDGREVELELLGVGGRAQPWEERVRVEQAQLDLPY